MPTYDYTCEKCGHTLEVFQSITEKPLKKCPECGKNGLRRHFGTGAALIFKGSGFYCTDYRKGSSTAASSNAPSSCDSCPKKESGARECAGASKPKGNAEE